MAHDEPALGLLDALASSLAPQIVDRLDAPDSIDGPRRSELLEVTKLRLQALDAAMALDAPELYTAQHRWDTERMSTTSSPVAAARFDAAISDVLGQHLSTQMLQRLDSMQACARDVDVHREQPGAASTLGTAARSYLDAAIDGRRDQAVGLVTRALEDGMAAAEVMTTVLEPAMVELGRRWQAGEVSVADEHATTATTQLCLTLLQPDADTPVSPHHLVATTVGSEAHEIGITMVCDLMRAEGWQTSYLGADVPAHDVLTYVAHVRPTVLAVSATMAGHLLLVRDLIGDLRADPRCAHVRVLVGGRPFEVSPRLAMRLDADGWARGAPGAVGLCRLWVQQAGDGNGSPDA